MEEKNHQQKFSLRDPTFTKPLSLAVLIVCGCQLVGIPVVMAYSTMILTESGFSYNQAVVGTLSLGIVKFISGFILPFLMDKWGRRPLIQLGTLGCALCNSLLVMLCVIENSNSKAACSAVILSAFLIFYTLYAGSGWTIAAELFSQKYRATALTISSSCAWVMATIITAAFLPLVGWIGPAGALAPFAFASGVLAIYFWYFLPETKKKTFQDIAEENFVKR